jgi:hypothetical protein
MKLPDFSRKRLDKFRWNENHSCHGRPTAPSASTPGALGPESRAALYLLLSAHGFSVTFPPPSGGRMIE